jgi:predicted TIM-barrel fold metal-dependent hydrolase
MRIDGFAHFLPERFRQTVLARLPNHPALESWRSLVGLFDIDLRRRFLDDEGVDRQVLMTTQPALEDLFDRAAAAEMARLANDGMAELAQRHGDRFYGVATVALSDPEEAARELERSVTELGLVGAQIYSNIAGRPLDAPELEPFWRKAEELDVPLWLHPARTPDRADYLGENASRFRLYLVFGWPYDTTLAMARLVFGGVLSRHPRLKIIVHHAGAMVPFFVGRVEKIYQGETMPDGTPAIEGFRRFYADTCTWGSIPALLAAYHTFGGERMIMGSDVPYGPEGGRDFLHETVTSLTYLPVPPAEREAIASGNLLRLLQRSSAV